MDQIESWQTHEGVVIGVPTGFSDLDLLTGGIQPGDMFVLAARPSVGKTAIGLNIATTAALSHNKGVIFFSLEMSSESLAIRMMSSLAEVPSHRMRQKSLLSKTEIERLTASSARIAKAPIKFFDDPGMNLYQIKAAARGWCKNNDVELMVVDYLQLVSVPGTKNSQRWQQVSEISSGLKALARELNVAILVLAQLNRDPERDNRTPRMSDLRESGSIEQDADCVALLHRADPEDDLVNLVLDKQRNGPTGMVPLLFRRSINKFVQSTVLPE
jgi:replicative DNA helicase